MLSDLIFISIEFIFELLILASLVVSKLPLKDQIKQVRQTCYKNDALINHVKKLMTDDGQNIECPVPSFQVS